MTAALLLALGASLAWGVADFVGPLWGRAFGALRIMLWAQAAGVAALVLVLAVRAEPPRSAETLLAIPAALAGTLGLYAYYRGMAVGAMTVIAPIAGVSAIVPVAFGIATGDRPSVPQFAGMACAIVGVGTASLERSTGSRRIAAGAGLALLAALGFGFYFPAMHAAANSDFLWASLIFRTTALGVVAVAAGVRRPELRLPRRHLAIAAAVGLGDTLGNVLYAASSAERGLVSLTSVLASLYPVVTVLLAARILREHVAPAQRAGIVLTLAGVLLIGV